MHGAARSLSRIIAKEDGLCEIRIRYFYRAVTAWITLIEPFVKPRQQIRHYGLDNGATVAERSRKY